MVKIKYEVIKKLRTWGEGDSGELEGLGRIEVVSSELIETRRWSISKRVTFKAGSKYYRYDFCVPNTDLSKRDIKVTEVFCHVQIIKRTTYLTKEERNETIDSRI